MGTPKIRGWQTVRQLRLMCHPELRRRGSGASKGDKDNSKEDWKNKCLVNKSLPDHTDKTDVKNYLWY